ncbi:MAG: UDP-N-acetylmuramoyl-L-alanyl-D-glutamate--2,6-diaminopimelate ligase [Chloroflexota bacterium]
MSNRRSLHQLFNKWRTRATASGELTPPEDPGIDRDIVNLVEHTKEVVADSCFFALVRTYSDGHPYIGQAIANGASVIIGQRAQIELDLPIPSDVTYIQVKDANQALAWMSAAWYDFPSDNLFVIGITGTNGKTTTAAILYEIMRAAGIETGLISTIKAVLGKQEAPTGLHVTTPAAPDLQRYLKEMVEAGLTHCILETTSMGLALYRVACVNFQIGGITNLTHEHIDYHRSFENYRRAKEILFHMLAQQPQGAALFNADDPAYTHFSKIKVPIQVSYGITRPADLRADDIRFSADQTRFKIKGANREPQLKIETSLVGRFNIYNILCAAGIGLQLGIEAELIQKGIKQVGVISGRMERINRGQSFLTIVDFAHTPDALAEAIAAARQMMVSQPGRIIALFGSAGRRDVEKRRLMAEVSAQLAELTILTAEDPREESLDEILEMMAAGCISQGGRENETFWRVPDRGRAIYFALTLAQPEDIVLICGKGHEQSMCFGTTEYPWDDRDATRAALDQWLQGEGMVNLGLPTFND